MLTTKITGYAKLALLIALVTWVASCKKESSTPFVYDASKAQTVTNIMYGSDTAEKMDAYLPAGRSTASTKILIMVHGGSWDEGDKTDFDTVITALQPLLPDYAIFNINYRLALNGKNIYPAALNDVALAIKFINSNANQYNVDTEKLVLGGASAGAHLALLQAYSQPSSNIKAVVDLFGPTDLTWLYINHPFPQFARPILDNFLGVSLDQDTALYNTASPITYVSASCAPTIIFHGTADDVVPIYESQELQNKLNSFNVANSFIVYNGEGHGWSGADLADTYLKIQAFLKLYVE